MKNKNNIFHYATKELTQDAFLRWLLENYDSDQEDVRHVSREIIKAFLDDGLWRKFSLRNIYCSSL